METRERIETDPDELLRAVREALVQQGDAGLRRVEPILHGGCVVLRGEVPAEEHRILAIEILEDRLGIEVRDELRVTPFGFERGERVPPPLPEDELEVRRALGTEDATTEDVFESEENGTVFSPPERPVRGPRES